MAEMKLGYVYVYGDPDLITKDPEAPAPVVRSEPIGERVVIDYDKDGNVWGVEFINIGPIEHSRSDILADDEVCACLDETGERKVRLYERCQRCGCFMEADYLVTNFRNREAWLRLIAAGGYGDASVKAKAALDGEEAPSPASA